MAYDVERQPGTWVANEASRRAHRFWIIMAAFFAATTLLLVLAVGHVVGATVAFAFLAATLAAKPYVERYADQHNRWLRGAQAEQAVGAELETLRADGWVLMHDIERPRAANIDHIASGPNGVYLVETKEKRYLDRDLKRVKGQAAQLHDHLGVWVTPVIAIHRREGKPFKTHSVWVVPRPELASWLKRQRNRPVEFERLARFADRL